MPHVSLAAIVAEIDRAVEKLGVLQGIDEEDRAAAIGSLEDVRDEVTALCTPMSMSPSFQMNIGSSSSQAS